MKKFFSIIIKFEGCISLANIALFHTYINLFFSLEHNSEIISIAVGMNSDIVATGELAEIPAIHIWNPSTLQNLGVIKGIHKKGISLMCFFK